MKTERETFEEIKAFCAKYDNFLFACVVISAVFYLKKHFHFGIFQGYNKRIDYKHLCKAKVLKYFLTLNRQQGYDGVLAAFYAICITHVKQIFFFWKLSFKTNRKLTIMEFKQVEDQVREHTKSSLETAASKEYMNEVNDLKELKVQLKKFVIKRPIVSTRLK